MKRTLIFPILTGFLFSGPATILAYEIETHADMSREAAKSSVLRDNSPNGVLRALGLQFPIEEDIKQVFPNSKNGKKSILELFRDGARFEDNNIRPLFHFFDPLNDEGLVFFTSPTWTLEDKGKIHLLQNYSFSDARSAFYEALTATNEDQRKTKFGKTFESLGRVIHHIHDMAQPQHVRSDAHLNFDDVDWKWIENPSLYESYTNKQNEKGKLPFDTYAPVNDKDDPNFLTTARAFWHTDNKNPSAGKGMAEFTSVNFLSAGTNFRGAFQNGGLIARSNERYPLPSASPATPTFHDVNSLFASIGKTPPAECAPPNNPCVMAFFRSEIKDNYRPESNDVNPKASTASIFDQDLQLYSKTVSYPNLDKCTDPSNTATCEQVQTSQIFSLNSFNFDEAHKFLIPRAVAYSAGLIDYFFRGRLEAEDATFTDTGVSLRVKNAIDFQKTPAWANEVLHAKASNGSAGSFTVAFDYQDSTGKTQYGVSNTVPMRASDTLAPGQVSADVYDFVLTFPSEAKEMNYRLVFRGKLGQEEDAVAVGQVGPISGFLVTPSYTPIDGIRGKRAIFMRGGQWKLDERPNLIAGNVDWKGWYVNGKPTKVLSWNGPATRYFPDPALDQNWGRDVYQNGEYFAFAPGPVLGAALAKDTAGREWLIVVCHIGGEDVVYRRTNERSEGLEGWEEIGHASATQLNPEPGVTFSEAGVPWFFRGDGREAQTLRTWRSAQNSYQQLMRMKFVINADVTAAVPSRPAELAGFRTEESCIGGYGIDGVGGANWNSQTTGEYIVAVDYKDGREVLAKVQVEARSVGSTQASDSNGTTSFEQQWREYFLWDGGRVMHYDQQRAINSSWTNRFEDFRETGTSSLYWRQFLYGLDLRNEVYAYTYWQSNQEYNISGTDQGYRKQGTDTISEGGSIDADGQPRTSIYSQSREPFTNVYTSHSIPVTQRLCQGLLPGGSYSDARVAYGTMDFSSPIGGEGGFAVDSNGNIAASFDYLNFDNQRRHFHHLTGASLPQAVPGAPQNARYAPIGVIR